MRQINVYSFGEKMPEVNKELIIIPSHLEGSDDYYRGKLENRIKILYDLINDTDDKAEKERYQKEIEIWKCNSLYGLRPERRLYAVHLDDNDEYNNTPVDDILDWEWVYVEDLQGDKK